MSDGGYWIFPFVGWDRSRPKGRRWDALVISVTPTDDLPEPDPKALAAERPGRVIVWGIWAPMSGWGMCSQEGPPRMVERFASAESPEQAPFRAALRLGVRAAMMLSLGLSDRDRDPFPGPGVN